MTRVTPSEARIVRERVEATTRFELVHNGFAARYWPQSPTSGSVRWCPLTADHVTLSAARTAYP